MRSSLFMQHVLDHIEGPKIEMRTAKGTLQTNRKEETVLLCLKEEN